MKEFFIWFTWISRRYVAIVFFAYFGGNALIFALSYFGLRTTTSLDKTSALANSGLSIIAFSILFALIINHWGKKEKNWRIAVDEAWKFAEENKLTDQSVFLYLFDKTKITKKPVRLNNWIENYKKWQDIRKEIGQLEKDREELPQRIADKVKEFKDLREILFTQEKLEFL